MKKIVEGAAVAMVPTTQKVSKEMEVFYNPVMKLNRDISLLLLEVLGKERKRRTEWEGFTIGSPLAGSGIRECRMLVELSPETIKSIEINDYDEKAAELIKKNIVLNEQRLNCDEIEVSCTEASKFLLDSFGHGYIEIDPFGTPNPFLDAAVKRIQREGILAVTATDTSALSGTYEDSCRRKYWAKPMRNHLMHDVGLRILIRKVQLIGTQYEKSLIPIYSYAKDHYMRVFFLCQKQERR
jgi:tRNA (guanine26-N2/guanine27-N2)-dimethyltransferase